MNTFDIDYDAKIITPTKALYQLLSQQANQLLDQAIISGNEVHTSLTKASLEFYNEPVETSLRWKGEISGKSTELYNYVNLDLIPTAKADYLNLVSIAADYSNQAQTSIQFFLDNPKLVTVESFNTLNQSMMAFIDSSMVISSNALATLNNKANQIIDFLINQPMQGLETIYYQSLELLLNSYFNLVSSLLINL